MHYFLSTLFASFSFIALSYCQNTTLDSILPLAQSKKAHSHQHSHSNGDYCGADNLHQQLYQNNPRLEHLQNNLESLWQRLVNENYEFNANRTVYTIPVVVHVVHNTTQGNIPNTQVQAAIQHLNDAFSNVGAYNPSTGVNTEIQFCLAQRDPMGNSTIGVTYTNSNLTNLDKNTQDAALKSLIQWDPFNYINIWVVNDILGGVAGYAYLPSAHGLSMDGIVLESNFMGTSPSNTAVLVHEMGHYLGLYHTFHGGCTNNNCLADGDQVCDTPPDNTTARPACTTIVNSCSTDDADTSPNNPFRPISMGGLGDQADEKENYMDYSNLICYDRFSSGQKDRMHFFLQGIRSSLLNSQGCSSPCSTPINIAFSASSTTVTAGATINFTNTTTGATSYNWLLNGTPFSSSTNSSYLFSTAGSYSITLQAMNGDTNCVTAQDSITITVYCAPPCSEVCDNGIDDDGNGLIDCLDPTCSCNECSGEQNNIWYFGINAGLDFNSDTPVVINNGQMSTLDATAVVNDANGNLLFYSNGVNIWDRTHTPMSNGTGLMGAGSTTQAALAVPKPGNPNLYFVFTAPYSNTNNGMRYSIVDLTLNNGLGNVTTKNTLMFLNGVEKLTAVRHCNNTDFWIIGHGWNSNEFYVYELTSAGLNMTPNIQAIGSVHSGHIDNKLGYLKASHDGKKLASAIAYNGIAEVFNFDNATGIISNLTSLTTSGGLYGLEFSPNNRFLYGATIDGVSEIVQFDLAAGSETAIQSSQTILFHVNNNYEVGGLQLAPNGKIYATRADGISNPKNFLAAINNPNSEGIACNFQDSALFLTPGFSRFGLPSFVQSYYPNTLPLNIEGPDAVCSTISSNAEYSINNGLYGCLIDSIVWTHSGINSINNFTDSTIVLNTVFNGLDTITVERVGRCNSTFDTIIINIDTSTFPPVNLGADTLVCPNGIVSLNASSNYTSYYWQDGTIDSIYTATESGLYWVECTDYCGVMSRDSILVTVDTIGYISIQDTILNNIDTLSLSFNPIYNYQWTPVQYINCDSCSSIQFFPNATTVFHVVVSNGLGCFTTDSFRIEIPLSTTEINESLVNTIKCYPNPAKDFVKIESSFEEIKLIRVYDANGRLIDIHNEIFAQETILSTSNYLTRIVFIQIFGETGTLTTKILIDK